MRFLCYILLVMVALGAASCNTADKKKEVVSSLPSSNTIASPDTLPVQKPVKMALPQTEEEKRLIQLLASPLDLKPFKKKAGGANGGVRRSQPYYQTPDTIGTYYEYFWFHALRRQYGESKSVGYLFVETYIYGDKIGNYNEVEEELIAIKAKASHASLGKINLVGKSRTTIEEAYGKPQTKHLGTSVYYHNKSFLLLHYEASKIDWFKYIKTNLTLDELNKLPADYFEYGGRNSK